MNGTSLSALGSQFSFEGAPVRIVMRDGEPWFVLADVCAVLGIGNPSMAADKLDADEKGISTVDTPGGPQEMVVVSESGLYVQALTSRKAGAKRFRKWITGTVIPTIRRTGSYGTPAAPALNLRDPAALLALSAELARELQTYQASVAALAPKAAALDRLAAKRGSENISDTAKALGMRPGQLFDWLPAHRWIFRRHEKAPWRGFQDKLDAGLLDHVESPDPYRPDRSFTTCMVTPKGRARLAELLEREQRSLTAV
jgi:anti-repressor protein